MKRYLFGALLALAGLTGSAQAQSWIFQPSYYSHEPISPVRVQRQYSRAAIFPSVGSYINSGYRFLRAGINVGGNTYSQLNMWESWYQVGNKY